MTETVESFSDMQQRFSMWDYLDDWIPVMIGEILFFFLILIADFKMLSALLLVSPLVLCVYIWYYWFGGREWVVFKGFGIHYVWYMRMITSGVLLCPVCGFPVDSKQICDIENALIHLMSSCQTCDHVEDDVIKSKPMHPHTQ